MINNKDIMTNKERVRFSSREWAKKNPEKVKRWRKEYYQKNKQRIDAKNKKWYTLHPRTKEMNVIYARKWRKDHLAKCKVCGKDTYHNRTKCYKCSHKGWRHSEETRLKMKEYKTRYVKEHPEEYIRLLKMSEAHKGKHLSKEQIEGYKIWRRTQVFPVKDTSIEVKIQNFLKELNIPFLTHQYMEIEHAYQCDILIPSLNLVIECDGDWWHGNINKYPNLTEWQKAQAEKDKVRTKELIEYGFKVLRLWEHDIKVMDLNKFKENLK